MSDRARVLVKEKIADAGVDLLRGQFDVELGLEWDGSELEERIGEFDGILIRSATKLTPELIERADRLKVIGRAGTGVDNVDVDAATKRGIVVANAPEANSIAAAEHTMALMLALCRNIPQAHASLAGAAWDRGKFKGTELYGKTSEFSASGESVSWSPRGRRPSTCPWSPTTSSSPPSASESSALRARRARRSSTPGRTSSRSISRRPRRRST